MNDPRGRTPGLYAGWVVVTACFGVLFGVWNANAGFGVFLPVLAREFHWSRGAISVALSINLLIGAILGLGVGPASDRYGPRAILAVGACLTGTGYLLASVVNALWHFYLFVGVLVGIGMGSMYLVTTATVSRWFLRERGLAVGILLAGLNLAYVTGSPLTAFLINSLGWRPAYLVLGGLIWSVAVPASLLVRHPAGTDRSTAGGTSSPSSGTGVATLGAAAADRRLWLLAGTWFLTGYAYYTVMVHIVSYVKDRGMTLERASLALTIWGLSLIVGSVLFGAVADRLGIRPAFWTCLGLQVIPLTWIVTGPPVWALYLLITCFGLGAAGSDTTVVKAAAEVFGVRAIGAVLGLMVIGWRLGAALGPAAAGFIHDGTGSYAGAFGIASLGLAVSGVTFTRGISSRRHEASGFIGSGRR